MNDKPWYQSRTILGFGVAGIVALAQVFDITYSNSVVGELVKYIAGFVGVWGMRAAIGEAIK